MEGIMGRNEITTADQFLGACGELISVREGAMDALRDILDGIFSEMADTLRKLSVAESRVDDLEHELDLLEDEKYSGYSDADRYEAEARASAGRI
jgi:plasmid stabilization system protein ParE